MQICCTIRRVQLFAFTLAAILVITVLTILFLHNYPSFARNRVIDEMIIKNNTMAMDRFETTAEIKNLRIEFYLFNITNADDVVKKSAKINLQEVGPFIYNEFRHKEILDNNQTSGLITFKLRKRYNFNSEGSFGDPKKINVTWPNVPLIVAKSVLDGISSNFKKMLAYQVMNEFIKNLGEPAFITDSVENFLFDGSKRELFEKLQNFDKIAHFIEPWPLKNNRFGLLYDKNDTWYPNLNPNFTASAGFGINQTFRDLNQFVRINGSKTMKFWKNEPAQCNQMAGTDGQFNSPFLIRDQNIQVYSVDICRKLQLKYVDTTKVNGITAWKYTFDPKSLQSGQKNPENQCYCLARESDGSFKPECLLDGLIDLSSCIQPGVVASGAHFAHGSKRLFERLTGLSHPNVSRDDPTIYVEPNTGLSIIVRVPLQMNIRLEPNRFYNFKFYKDPDPLIIPLLWLSENAELTADQASLLRRKLLLLDSWMVFMVLGGSILVMVVIIVLASIICIKLRKSPVTSVKEPRVPTETDPLIPTSNTTD